MENARTSEPCEVANVNRAQDAIVNRAGRDARFGVM